MIQDKKDRDVELCAPSRWNHPDAEIFGLPTSAHLLDDAKEHRHQRLSHKSPKTIALEVDIKHLDPDCPSLDQEQHIQNQGIINLINLKLAKALETNNQVWLIEDTKGHL